MDLPNDPVPPDTRPRKAPKHSRLALTLLALIWLAFDFPVLKGHVLFPVEASRGVSPYSLYEGASPPLDIEHDAFLQYFPLRAYLSRRLASGEVPLWDPHRMGGAPFAANPQAAIWYPPNWFFAIGNTLTAYSLLAVFSRLAALLIAYWFFRVLRIHPLASVGGATAFVFSGFFMSWSLHPTFLASGMWVPLALGGTYLALNQKTRQGIVLGSVGLALSILGGHPQIAMYVWLTTAIWAAVLLTAQVLGHIHESIPRILSLVWRSAAKMVATFVLAAGLASLQILSSLELARRAVRVPESFENVFQFRLPPAHIMTFLVPDRLGNPRNGNYVGILNFNETAVYVGVFSLVLVLVALWRRPSPTMVAFAVTALIGGLAAFGTPVLRVLFESLPLLSQARIPTRFVFLAEVGLAGLTALGLDVLLKNARAAIPALTWSSVLVSSATAATLILERQDPRIANAFLLPRVGRAMAIVAAGTATVLVAMWLRRRVLGAILICSIIAFDLWLANFGYHRFQEPRPILPQVPEIEFLSNVTGVRPRFGLLGGFSLPPNTALQHGLYGIEAYDNLLPASIADLLNVAQPDQRQTARHYNLIGGLEERYIRQSPVLDLLGVRSLIATRGTSSLRNPSFAGKLLVFNRPTALPPAFAASCWELSPADQVGMRIGHLQSQDLRSIVFVDEESASEVGLKTETSGACHPQGPATILSYQPERIVLRARVNRPSILVLTDAWYPGWRGSVDGSPTPLLRVDLAFRGILLAPGSHLVTFEFRPSWLTSGVFLTVASLVLLSLFGAGGALGKRLFEPYQGQHPDHGP